MIYVEILGGKRNPAQFHDKRGPVAKWIRRRFPTPKIAGSSPARVDANFSTKKRFMKNAQHIYIYTHSELINWKVELETIFLSLLLHQRS